MKTLARRVACVVVAALVLVVAAPGAASAREHPRLVLREGKASERYPAITGVYPVHGAAARAHCGAAAGCDLIPLTIEAPPSNDTTDVLLTIRLTWNADDRNAVNAALFSDNAPASDPLAQAREGNAGRNESAGLVKWTSGGGDGSLVLRAANLASGGYALTVSNSTGENKGFTLVAQIDRHVVGAATASAGAQGAPSRVQIEPDASESIARGGANVAVAPGQGRVADARYDGAVGVPAALSKGSDFGGVAGALVLVAVLLLVGVAFAWWRTSHGRTARRARFRDLRLFWKLMAPFVVVILVVGVVGTFVTARYLADRADSELDRRLVQGNAAAAGYLRDQEFTLLDATRFAANVQGLPEAVADADAAAAERALASVAAVNEDLDV
ncbi:MAG TPA: hypothetical protein VNB24_03375, partial [Acidimicrobiales bacterium]|nr:hypothetical protein [Acidimicrobiales bacterium]